MRTKSAIAIDLANVVPEFRMLLRKCGLDPNSKVDYEKLVNAIAFGSEIISKTVYLGINKETAPGGQARFVFSLRHRGFNVVEKPFKSIKQKDGTTKHKSNFDVEIALDLISISQEGKCDKIFLFSGDSDFAYLIKKIKEHGKISVTVVASKNSISKELSEIADDVIFLEELSMRNYILK